MNILKRVNPLLCTSRVLVKKGDVLSSLCSTAKVPCRSRLICRHLTSNLTSWPLMQQESARLASTRRCFSEMDIGRSHLLTKTDVLQHESREMDDDSNDERHPSQRSTETWNLEVLVTLLRQENAGDICVIKVPEHIKYAEHFIVVSGVSPRHLRAMALYAVKVYKFLRKEHDAHVRIEGKNSEDWMCIDFGKIIVHFMLPEIREVYELEKLWTLRSHDEQLGRIPDEKLPEDFIYDLEEVK
ncbi:mitochondrial assembly of ribosomal large subunit protein 1 [Stigmatopora argus]